MLVSGDLMKQDVLGADVASRLHFHIKPCPALIDEANLRDNQTTSSKVSAVVGNLVDES